MTRGEKWRSESRKKRIENRHVRWQTNFPVVNPTQVTNGPTQTQREGYKQAALSLLARTHTHSQNNTENRDRALSLSLSLSQKSINPINPIFTKGLLSSSTHSRWGSFFFLYTVSIFLFFVLYFSFSVSVSDFFYYFFWGFVV